VDHDETDHIAPKHIDQSALLLQCVGNPGVGIPRSYELKLRSLLLERLYDFVQKFDSDGSRLTNSFQPLSTALADAVATLPNHTILPLCALFSVDYAGLVHLKGAPVLCHSALDEYMDKKFPVKFMSCRDVRFLSDLVEWFCGYRCASKTWHDVVLEVVNLHPFFLYWFYFEPFEGHPWFRGLDTPLDRGGFSLVNVSIANAVRELLFRISEIDRMDATDSDSLKYPPVAEDSGLVNWTFMSTEFLATLRGFGGKTNSLFIEYFEVNVAPILRYWSCPFEVPRPSHLMDYKKDLTREGVEPNPGPNYGAFMHLAKGFADGFVKPQVKTIESLAAAAYPDAVAPVHSKRRRHKNKHVSEPDVNPSAMNLVKSYRDTAKTTTNDYSAYLDKSKKYLKQQEAELERDVDEGRDRATVEHDRHNVSNTASAIGAMEKDLSNSQQEEKVLDGMVQQRANGLTLAQQPSLVAKVHHPSRKQQNKNMHAKNGNPPKTDKSVRKIKKGGKK